MFVYTMNKKKAIRMGALALAVFAGIAVGTAAIFSSLKSNAAEKKVPIYCVERNDKKITLTFDCAWGNSNTDELLSILEEEDVPAAFFVSGEFASKYPEDVRQFAEAGNEIGNHSNIHPHVNDLNINDLIADTKEAERKISSAAGTMSRYYRTPYGEYNDTVITTIEGMGYQVIQWSADSIDWKESDPEKIKERISETVTDGGILLFHNDLPVTVEALPDILKDLKAKGYEFVPLSQLVYADDYTIDQSGKQIKSQKAWGTLENDALDVNAGVQSPGETDESGQPISTGEVSGTVSESDGEGSGILQGGANTVSPDQQQNGTNTASLESESGEIEGENDQKG